MEFHSERELEAKRAEKRQAREQILNEAKRKYDIEEKKAAAAKARGEDKWLLPELSDNLSRQAKKMKKKMKKLKKEKHSKRDKKAKKSKKNSKSDSSESEEEEMWVEKTKSKQDVTLADKTADSNDTATAVVKGPKLQRDDWMSLDSASIPTISRLELREKIKQDKLQYADLEKEEKVLDEPGAHEKELNPYWKSGSRQGLPEENKSADSLPKHSLPFLKKAYSRCEQLAAETGQSMESIAEERYGSLENLEVMIMEAEREEELLKNTASNTRSTERSRSRSTNRRHRRSRSRSNSRRHRRSRSRSNSRRHRRSRSRSSSRRHRRSRSRSSSRRHRRSRSRSNSRRHIRSRSRSNSRRHKRSRSRSSSRRHRRSRSGSANMSRSFTADKRQMSPPHKRRFMKPGESDLSEKPKKPFKKPVNGASSGDGYTPSWRKPGSETRVKADESSKSQVADAVRSQTTAKPPVDSSPSSSSSSEASSGESDAEDTSMAAPLTDDEMNALGAKILRAELMGNDEMVTELKLKLENARKARTSGVKTHKESEKVVILSHADKFGNIRPVKSLDQDATPGGGRRRKAKKVTTHNDKGERERYFADDDRFSIKDMVQAERTTTAEDQHYMFSKMAAKVTEKTDDDNQIDDAMINKARLEYDPSRAVHQQQQRAKAESKQMSQTLDNCKECLENKTKHLIISVAKNTYLCMPDKESLCQGHCRILPIHHCMSSTVCDEDVWNEVQEFRRTLTKMFADDGQDCVFIECSKNLKRLPHMAIECVPLPQELGDLAPIYFKKAIDECEKDWAQNKKLIDISKKSIRNCVPKGFPYFSVDFGLQGGFAHVIEEEHSFPWYFGQEVVGGMMDVEPRLWKNPRKESFEDQRKKVMNFSKMWKSYDFTITKDSDSDSDSK